MQKLMMLLILLLPCTALAADKAGEVSKYEGKVLIYRDGGARGTPIDRPGEALGVGDAVTTKRDATAYVAFIDGNRVIVKENSTLTVKTLNHNEVGTGKVLFDIRKRGDLKGFEVTSATVTMGVRGTRFAVENRDGKVAVHLKEGKLNVIPTAGKFQRHSPDDLEGFQDLRQELQVQTDAAKDRMRQQFEESKKHMLAGDLEYVEQIDLEAGSSLIIEGNEVWQAALPDWAEQDFALFDQFDAPMTEQKN